MTPETTADMRTYEVKLAPDGELLRVSAKEIVVSRSGALLFEVAGDTDERTVTVAAIAPGGWLSAREVIV